MDEQVLTMELAADFGNVDIARAAIQGISDSCFGHGDERAADITLAAIEAVNNVVEHSGAPAIKVAVVWNGKELRVMVISGGAPFDPTAVAVAVGKDEMPECTEGGYGLSMIRELVDRFEYEYRDSCNVVTLGKFANH